MEVAPCYTLLTLLTLSTLFILLTLFTLFVNTVKTALHYLNSRMYAHILLRKVRTPLEVADVRLSKIIIIIVLRYPSSWPACPPTPSPHLCLEKSQV